jgi:hypothetical protein
MSLLVSPVLAGVERVLILFTSIQSDDCTQSSFIVPLKTCANTARTRAVHVE